MLSDNLRHLLNAVADGNMQRAQQAALAICATEKSAINLAFCQRVSDRIKANGPGMMQLTPKAKNLLYQENVIDGFRPERYYLTKDNATLVDKVRSVHNVSEMLAGAGISYLNSALLTGIPGTGKSLLARYIAWKLDLPFLYVNLTQVISSTMGSSSNNLGVIFSSVESGPCVLLLDELDAFSSIRGSTEERGSDAEMSRVTTALMQSLDRVKGEVVILGATNRPELIDPAVKRRFRIHHEVLPLTLDETIKMADHFLSDVISKGMLPVTYDKTAMANAFTAMGETLTPSRTTDYLIQRLAAALSQGAKEVSFPIHDE